MIDFKVCDLIRQYQPRTVISHWSGSWHKDHQNSFMVTRDAVFYAGLKSVKRQLPGHGVRKLFFADNWEDAAGYQPNLFLNVTPVYDNWLKACCFLCGAARMDSATTIIIRALPSCAARSLTASMRSL
jgi:LmbE family N-acetylglucosaminyl deacetylase